MKKVRVMTELTLIPISRDPLVSSAMARIARPVEVFWMYAFKPSMRAAAISISTIWGREIRAPMTSNDSPCSRIGKARGFGPAMALTPYSSENEAPTAVINTANRGAARSGR